MRQFFARTVDMSHIAAICHIAVHRSHTAAKCHIAVVMSHVVATCHNCGRIVKSRQNLSL